MPIDTPVALDPSDVEEEGAASAPASPPVTLSSSDVEDSTPPGPVNPYANPPGTPAPAAKPAVNPNQPIVTAGGPAPQTMFQRARAYVANSPVGRSLEQSAPNLTADLGLTPTESEAARTEADFRPETPELLQYHPVLGAQEVKAGAKNLYQSVQGHNPNNEQAAVGAVQMMGGAMSVAKPAIVAAIAMNPIKSAIQYGAGVLGGMAASEVAKRMGATPNEQEFFHVAGFFIPSVLTTLAGIKTASGDFKYTHIDPITGKPTDIPVSGAKVRGPGFAGAVGRDESGGIYVGGRVGRQAVGVRFGGRMPGEAPPAEPTPEAPRPQGGPVAGQLGAETQMGTPAQPPPPPNAVAVQQDAQLNTIVETATRAAAINLRAAQVAGLAPPPPPPPKPGEAGSHQLPMPDGMQDGHLTQQTVEMAAHAIQSLPEDMRAKGTREAVGHLAGWMEKEKTIVGPDNKVVNVDSPKMAQTEAVKLINAEVDRHAEMAENAAKEQAEAQKQQQEDAKVAQQEREETVAPTKPAESSTGNAEPVQIPNTPAVKKARAALQAAPDHFPAEKLENVIRNTAMVTTPVRKALVQEEIQRRQNRQEDAAQDGMMGQPIPPGQSREELQRWADAVKNGEHPYLHVPPGNSFVPAGVDDLKKTSVKGSGAFNGTYYHPEEISPADIRKAARDKENPQAALDALKDKMKPAELAATDVEEAPAEEPAAASNQVEKPEAKPEGDLIVKDLRSGKVTKIPQVEPLKGMTPLGAKEANEAPKVGDKITFSNFSGKEQEGTVKALKPNGSPIVQDAKGKRSTVPVVRIKTVAPKVTTEDNTSHGSQANPASVDTSGAGRPPADTGSGDRVQLESVPEEVRAVPGEGRDAQEPSEGNSPPLRRDLATVPEQGNEPGPGPGDNSGLDQSPAIKTIEKAKKQSAKVVTLNRDWYSHPENWQAPSGEVTRLEGNLAALRLLREVEKKPRTLTDAEKQTLANYVGWGSLSKVFNPYNSNYSEQARWRNASQELQKLLSPEEYEAAKRSTTNAHYTSPEVVRFMWDIAGRFGFKSGNVLEPSMGVGNFFGMMPKSIRGKVNAIGNELDPVTYGIARQLYPGATLFNKDFKDLILPDNEVDFAIGNVPFGDWSIYDPKYPKMKALIHDYFMVKSLDKVKPGGVAAFITSTGTMDKANSSIRSILASKANLIAAFRLPSTAFKANAGTSVTTDLIILQKRAVGEAPGGEAWINSPELQVTKEDGSGLHSLNVNEYYQAHNDNMLGRPVASTRMYGGLNFMLKESETPIEDLLKAALGRLPKGIMLDEASRPSGLDMASTAAQYAPDNVLEKQYVLNDKGEVKQRINGKLVRPAVIEGKDGTIIPAKLARLKDMIGLRGKMNDLLSDMVTQPDDEEANAAIAKKREALQKAYEAFVKKNGLLNSPTNRVFEDDPHFPRLLALEHYDRATRTATPADIFRRRTIFPRQPLRTVSADPKEALQQILGERGYPDINLMARLQGKTPAEAASELVKAGLIFRDPSIGDYITREKYLSGYVRDKLAEAKAAVEQGMKEYEPNVKALEAVIPEDIHITDDPATSISVRLGSTWIPIPALRDFFTDTFKTQGQITYDKGTWAVAIKGRYTPELVNQWGTDRVSADKLFEDALNQKQSTVYDRSSDGSSTLNKDKTTLAQAAQERIRQEFQRWAGASKWKEQLETAYNHAYNNLVTTEYDGSHLQFPGMNEAITLKPHQVNAVWRILQDGRGLLAHEVGAGKTFEMAAAIMEGRRVGTFKKPMLTVPNHIVEQFRKEFLLLYPGANILVPTEKDFDARNRQRIMSHIATGDYDAIILPHSQFNLMDISPERQAMTIQGQLDELEETIQAMKAAGQDKRTVKQMEKSKEKLNTSLAKLKDLKADRAINFDDTGVDALFVDEAHNFKNLSYYTKMTRVAGLQQAKAKSALRLKMKTEYLQDMNNGRGVIFATGTPVQNTMAELYTMIKYVAPDVLEKAGIRFFDDWAANFGSTITAMELSADGRSYKARTKFARFQNVPELMQMFRSFADVKTADDLNLERPELEGGKPILITVPGSPDLQDYVTDLMKRAEDVRSGTVDPKKDNMLKVTTDGRKAATDLRLIDMAFGDAAESKINAAIGKMFEEWQEGAPQNLTQMGFLDLYRSVDDADHEIINLYNDMRDKLVAKGIPREQIAVIGEHDTRIKRQALFDKVNKGMVRILFGSTQRMGAGTNAQKLLKALHHIDLTWRPGDLSQREGRILRQGNTNKSVRIYNYLTEKSFDAYMAQTLQSKAEFISQILSGKAKDRVMVDAAADMVLSLEEMKIAASGNPDVKLKYDLEMKRAQLLSIERGFEAQKRNAQYSVETAELRAAGGRTRLAAYNEAQDKINTVKGDDGKGFSLAVDGKQFTDRKAATEYLKAMEVPTQNFWMEMNGIGISVRTLNEKGEPEFFYEMAYGDNGRPPDRTMESLGLSVEAKLRNLASWIDATKQAIANAETDAAKYAAMAKRTDFPERAELDRVNAQLKEVEGRLGLGNVNAGSQANADAVAADASAETEDVDIPDPDEDDEPLDGEAAFDRPSSDSVWRALGSENGGEAGFVEIPEVLVKAVDYLRKAGPATWNELTSSIGSAGKSAKDIGREFMAVFAPGAVAEEDAQDVMGRAVGEPALRIYEASQFLDGVKKMFAAMPAADHVDFIDRWQRGQAQPNPDLEKAQQFMQSVLEEQRQREMLAANLGRKGQQVQLSQKENYFPNRYKRAPGDLAPTSEEEQIERIGATSRRPFEGSKTFMKQQKYTMKEAVEKGAVPLGDPVDILLRRLQEGAKYVAAKYAMENFKDLGIVVYVRQGQKVPQGFVRINDKVAKVWRPVETAEGGVLFKQSGEWVGEQDAMRMLNNYLSKDHLRDSNAGTALVNLKNMSTEMRLSFSPFHWAYITVESIASGLNTGLDQFYNQGIRHADPAKMAAGLKDVATAIASPYNAVKVGGQMRAYAKDPEGFLATPEGEKFAEQYPDFPHLQALLFHGGLRWSMPSGNRLSAGEGFEKAMANGELGKGFLKATPWLSHLLSKPLFEHYIPRAKWVFAVKMLSQKLAQYSDQIAAGKMSEDQIARDVAATTDNRFGEFNWDALWLNNTLRTGLQVGFRSATWKIGSWRGAYSAGRETFSSKAFDDRIFEHIEENATPFERAAARLPQLGMNAGWLLSMAVTTAVMGSVLGRLLSGKWPWEWAEEAKNGLPKLGNMALEAMHFRTGAVDRHGEPIRGSFPTGLRDYEHGLAAPGKYIKGSESDIVSNAVDTMVNRDFFNNYVFNPNDPLIKQFWQGLEYNLKGDFSPMGVSNFERSTGSMGERLGRASGMVGGAPKYIDESHALREALSLRAPSAPATPEQKEEWEMLRQGPPTRFEIKRAIRDRDLDWLEKVVKYQLSYTDAMKVMNDPTITPAERATLAPILARKRVDAVRSGRFRANGR